MSDTVEKLCPNCGRIWPEDSEQAACVDVYGQCIVCCSEKERYSDFKWDLSRVLERQKRKINVGWKMSAEITDRLQEVKDMIDHLQHCQSALEDIYQQAGGRCPDGVEPMTWARVKLLVEGVGQGDTCKR